MPSLLPDTTLLVLFYLVFLSKGCDIVEYVFFNIAILIREGASYFFPRLKDSFPSFGTWPPADRKMLAG